MECRRSKLVEGGDVGGLHVLLEFGDLLRELICAHLHATPHCNNNRKQINTYCSWNRELESNSNTRERIQTSATFSSSTTHVICSFLMPNATGNSFAAHAIAKQWLEKRKRVLNRRKTTKLKKHTGAPDEAFHCYRANTLLQLRQVGLVVPNHSSRALWQLQVES